MKRIGDNALSHLSQLSALPELVAGRYRLKHEIARGGMGTVYLAEDIEFQRELAIKVLNPSHSESNLAERMLREAKIIASLEHPGIVPIHDVGSLPDGRVFYAMKLVRGDRLEQHLAKLDSLSEKLRIFQRVCEAVAFAHAHGVLHRDLKPQNIMVGAFNEVLVMDWGAAKILGQNSNDARTRGIYVDPETGRDDITAHGTVIGTPAFMSPEQALGQIERIDKRSDIFSLGAILFLLLEGRSPEAHTLILEGRSPRAHEDRSSEVIEKRFETRVPKTLRAICLKAMAQDPALRYESAVDLSADLDNYLEGKPVSAYKENVVESAARWIDKNRFVFYLIVAYLLMRVVFLAATGR